MGMQQKSKTLMHLSLCRKAGKLILGFDAVREGVVAKRVFAVALAKDLSEKTRSNIIFAADREGVPAAQLPDTLDELMPMVGKRAGVLGIADQSLAGKLVQLVQMAEHGGRCL